MEAAASLLLRAGIVLGLVSLLPIGCGIALAPRITEVPFESLADQPPTHNVYVIGGFAQPADAVEFDPHRALQVSLGELARGSGELTGRTVEVDAVPLAVAILRRYQVDRAGQRTMELGSVSSIYAPLTPAGDVWAVSAPAEINNLQAPEVVAYRQKTSFVGVVQPLSRVIDLKLIRDSHNKEPDDGEGSERGLPVTDRAVAVVDVGRTGTGPRVVFAPIMGTGRSLWVAAVGRELPQDELRGDWVDCSKLELCKRASGLIDPPPRALLVITTSPFSGLEKRIRNWGFAGLALGVLAIAGAVVLKRRTA